MGPSPASPPTRGNYHFTSRSPDVQRYIPAYAGQPKANTITRSGHWFKPVSPSAHSGTVVIMQAPWGKRRGLEDADGRDREYPLACHLCDAAAAALSLWEDHTAPGVREWIADELDMTPHAAGRFVAYLAGLHDIGKAIPGFQCQDGTDKIRHETASYLTAPTLIDHPERVDPFTSGVAHRIGEILGGHHGLYQPVDRRTRRPLRVPELGGPDWDAARRAIHTELRSHLNPTLPARLPEPVAAVLTGLVIVADWIVSDTRWILENQWDAPTGIAARWDHTLATTRDRIHQLGLAHPEPTPLDLARLLGGPDRSPNPLQQSIVDDFHPTGPGLLTIATPTGSGKTETAWIAAHRLSAVTGRHGTLMCLPTQATTNSMWARTSTTIDNTVTLAHSMAEFHSPYRHYSTHDPDALRWLNGRKRPMLSAHAVVTIDQLLAAGLTARHNAVRQWALAGKVVIVDEVHACDVYMLTLLARVLEWLGRMRVPVVLLSATLPGHVSRQLTAAYLTGAGNSAPELRPVAYPGWVWHPTTGGPVEPRARAAISRAHARTAHVTVTHYTGRVDTAATNAVRPVADEGGCAAVVCSTIDTAQRVYTRIRDTYPGMRVWMLHSRFPHSWRAEIETEIVGLFGRGGSRPDGVVVATSVIEQSLDVDFDVMISELAPAALLFQRLGRVWRHHNPRPAWATEPTLQVLDTHGDLPHGPAAIYRDSLRELHATRAALADHGTLVRIPEDVSTLVQRVHDHDLNEPDDAQSQRERRDTGLADIVAIPSPQQIVHLHELTRPDVDDATVASRLGMDTVRLIPAHTGVDGRYYLDPKHETPYPDGRPPHRFVAAALAASITCPATWVHDWPTPPEAWAGTHLADARPFPNAAYGGLRLDPELGLVKGNQ